MKLQTQVCRSKRSEIACKSVQADIVNLFMNIIGNSNSRAILSMDWREERILCDSIMKGERSNLKKERRGLKTEPVDGKKCYPADKN